MSAIWGVDYASVDGNHSPDRAAFTAAGGRMVWQRASFAYYDKGHEAWACAADPHFLRDWSGWFATNGITCGAYWIVEPKAAQTPEEQVAVFHKATVDAGRLIPYVDFPPCIDVEFPRGIGGTGLDRAGVMKWLRRAIVEMRRLFNVAPIIYTSKRVWEDTDLDCLGNPSAPDLVDLIPWLARYAYPTRQPAVLPPPNGAPPAPKLWGWWGAWQDQGDALHTPGFTATVDIDEWNTIHPNDVGPAVAAYQRRLGLVADGAYGPKTLDAVKGAQREHGLDDDGIIGPATGAAIMWMRQTGAAS